MTQKEIIHFAHANGFPAGTYNKLLRILGEEYHIIAVEKFGHDPKYPVDENWASLVNELIDYVEKNANDSVIGVGHSMGGVLTFLAAYQRPELFKQIIILDPPLLYGLSAWFIAAAKKLQLFDRMKHVMQAKNRRKNWSNAAEAEAYFKNKNLFKHVDPDCLRDYISFGTIPTENGVVLGFDTTVEAAIFRTTPHNIGRLRNSVNVPGKVVLGKDTYRVTKFTIGRFVRRHNLLFEQLDFGSHLFPIEYPDRTAFLVKESIAELKRTTI